MQTKNGAGQDDIEWREERRRRRRKLKRIACDIALRCAPLYRSWHDVQTLLQPVKLVQHSLALPRFPKTSPPLRVAFISDLHYGPTVGHMAPAQAWRHVRAARPDMLILGGDYIFLQRYGLREIERELKKCGPFAAGAWAVWGNHDDRVRVELSEIFRRCGVRVLNNQSAPLPEPWGEIYIAGVDDDSHGQALPHVALSQVPTGACTIFVAHAPGIYEKYPENDCDVTICGDTHGGQLCLPGGRPLLGARTFCGDYIAGLYRPNEKYLFVSRGVGTVTVPLRTFAAPDVALLELHA